jgi:hypothetical protein
MKPVKEFSAGLLVVLILVFAAATVQAKKPDKPGGGHGGDDHADPPAKYCAKLTSGGFDFGNQTVTRNNRGSSYNSPDSLDMSRPLWNDPIYSQSAWDLVFSTCPVLKSSFSNPNMGLDVSDDWSIDNYSKDGAPGSQVVISFRNGHTDLRPDIEVDLHLVGILPEPGIPTADTPGVPVSIVLNEFWFNVQAHGTDSCRIQGSFGDQNVDDSVLEMTWDPCQ